MSVHSCALLEAALRGEERAIKNGSHGEHSTYDGTCSVGVVRTDYIKLYIRKGGVRCQKVRERLARLAMGNEDGRDFITEERACGG